MISVGVIKRVFYTRERKHMIFCVSKKNKKNHDLMNLNFLFYFVECFFVTEGNVNDATVE